MSSFVSEGLYLPISWKSLELNSHIDGLDARGGSTLTLAGDSLIIFGGADRGQCHFGDLWMYKNADSVGWHNVECTGDVPTARSGHAVTYINNLLLLYGGIDFAEEAVYNDLYMLNLETWEWKYIGESGEEVPPRNSHTLSIVTSPMPGDSHQPVTDLDRTDDIQTYLVVYGGASPEAGPMSDVYYAELSSDFKDKSEVFVTWKKLLGSETSSPSPCQSGPGKREMHSTCTYNGSVYIVGGRDEEGEVLSDVWQLSARSPASHKSSSCEERERDRTCPLQWRRLSSLSLSCPRCSHGAVVLEIDREQEKTTDSLTPVSMAEEAHTTAVLCVFGGFTGLMGVSDDLCVVPLHSDITQPASTQSGLPDITGASTEWRTVSLSKPIAPRFGLAMCLSPPWLLSPPGLEKALRQSSCFTSHTGGTTLNYEETVAQVQSGIVVFGGINMDRDFNDFWLLIPH